MYVSAYVVYDLFGRRFLHVTLNDESVCVHECVGFMLIVMISAYWVCFLTVQSM